MIHLSNISINPEYIVYIQWNVIRNQYGDQIQPSIAVYLNQEKFDSENNPIPVILHFPEDSPNAKLLRKWRDRQLTLIELHERQEMGLN